MTDLKAFRKANNLLQKDVAEYLGVSREFVSLAESGKAPFPSNHLRKLHGNDRGWDVSMLALPDQQAGDSILQNGGQGNIGKIGGEACGELLALRREVEILRQQVDELKEEKARYWEMIVRLTDRCGACSN